MLHNNLELIVQYPEGSGYICRGFKSLRLKTPAYVVFEGADVSDQSTANLIGDAFCQEVLRYIGATEELKLPCNRHLSKIYCHAMKEPSCLKLLVRPAATGSTTSTGTWPIPSADAMWLSPGLDSSWTVIPAMPFGSTVSANIPPQWQGINVCFWASHPIEVIWAVMQRSGLAPAENRIFISYVRKDTTPIADQLFEALTKEGFDVFLDRCSVPVGVQFQERLMQDICDKAMVVLLNSNGVTASHWVGEEIAIIKAYRLGLLELRFPDGKLRPDIDPDFTQLISSGDLVPAGASYANHSNRLSTTTLANVVSHIKEVHGRALHRRRYELIDNFAAALMSAGKTAQILSDGTFLVSASVASSDTVVGLSVRPPELGDFCSLHQRGSVSGNRPGCLISPSPFFLAHRQEHVSWLGGLSNIQHLNEAQILQLVAKL